MGGAPAGRPCPTPSNTQCSMASLGRPRLWFSRSTPQTSTHGGGRGGQSPPPGPSHRLAHMECAGQYCVEVHGYTASQPYDKAHMTLWRVGTGPHKGPQKRLGRRLEEVAKAVGSGNCWSQMPWKLALTAAAPLGGRPGGRGGTCPPPIRCITVGGRWAVCNVELQGRAEHTRRHRLHAMWK